jgi:type IV secretion system protein VirD4
MSAKPNLWKTPRTLGGGPGQMLTLAGIAAALVLIALALQVSAIYGGAIFHYDPALGRPWIHRPGFGPFVLAPELYTPVAPIAWIIRYGSPFGPAQSAAVVHVLSQLIIFMAIAVGFAIVLTVAFVAALDRYRPQSSELHDSGHWAAVDELREIGIMDATGGPIVGGYELRPGKVVPLRYDGENGMEYVAPPGEGKTALLKTNLLIPLQDERAEKWSASRRREEPWGEEPSMILLDLKGELLESTSGYQKRKLLKDVIAFAPYGIRGWDDEDLSQYNTFSTIRMRTPDTFDDCYAKGIDIADAEGKGLPTHWDKTCCAWYAGVIEKLGHMSINTGDLDYFSLPGLYDFLASFVSLDDCIRFMLETEDDPKGLQNWTDFQNGEYVPTKVSPTVAAAAREMAMKEGPEKTSVHSTAMSFLTYLRSRRIRRFVMRSTWDMKTLATDAKRARIVYIVIPPGKLKAIRPLLRMMVNDLIRTNMDDVDVHDGRSVRSNVRSLIFVGDEIAALKNLDELETSSGYARGFGVMFWLFWQSVFQKYKHYTENEAITETLDVSVFGRPKTTKAARYVVDLMGKIDLSIRKRSLSGKRTSIAQIKDQQSESNEEVARDLLTTTELRRMDKAHSVGIWNGLTIWLTKFDYWKNPILLKRSRIPCVKKSDRTRDPEQPIIRPERSVQRAAGIVAGAAAQRVADEQRQGQQPMPPAPQAPPPALADMPAFGGAATATLVPPAEVVSETATSAIAEQTAETPSPGEQVIEASASAFAILHSALGTALTPEAPEVEPEGPLQAAIGAVELDEKPADVVVAQEPEGVDDDDPLAALRAGMHRLSLSTDLAPKESVTDDGYTNGDSVE